MLVHLPGGYKPEQAAPALAGKICCLPEAMRRSLTWDQGAEMRDWKQIAIAAGIEVFFCDPHKPWQRATNENTNGLRQYFPKGTDLSVHSDADLDWVAAEVNDRPRTRFGLRKPDELIAHLLQGSPSADWRLRRRARPAGRGAPPCPHFPCPEASPMTGVDTRNSASTLPVHRSITAMIVGCQCRRLSTRPGNDVVQIRAHVGPEQRGEPAPAGFGEANGLIGEDALQQQGVDVYERVLDELACRFGLYATSQLSVRVRDTSLIADAIARLRANPPVSFGAREVLGMDDLANGACGPAPTDGLRFCPMRG